MNHKYGVLEFDYKGRRLKIPYSNVPWGGSNRLHLIDKKRCVHILDLIEGKWRPIRPSDYPLDFLEVLDWVIKQELGG